MGLTSDDEVVASGVEPARRIRKRRKWAALAGLLVALVVGAVCWAYSESPVSINHFAQVPGHATYLVVFTQDVRWGPTSLTVEETSTEVRVRLVGRRFPVLCSCVGRYVATLSGPLGARRVVDAARGQTMPVGVDDSWVPPGDQ